MAEELSPEEQAKKMQEMYEKDPRLVAKYVDTDINFIDFGRKKEAEQKPNPPQSS